MADYSKEEIAEMVSTAVNEAVAPLIERFSKTEKKEETKDNKTVCFNYDEDYLVRPKELDCEVVRFQNSKDKWIAFVGLKNGKPYEIFTGLADDEEGILLPKTVTEGKIIKTLDENGESVKL